MGGQGSRWSILPLGLTYLHRLLARALLVRGMARRGAGWCFGGSRAAICSGSSPPAGQARTPRTPLDPVGKGGAGGQKPLSPPAGRGVGADGPEPTLPRTPSPLPKLTKEQPCRDRPPGSFWEAQLDSVRPDAPSPLAGTERSQCSQRVGTQWALPGPECFHQHQLIPRAPILAGSQERLRERESHHCPNPEGLISLGTSWTNREWPCLEGGFPSCVLWLFMAGLSRQLIRQPWGLSVTDRQW